MNNYYTDSENICYSRFYLGSLWTFLNRDDADRQFASMSVLMRSGFEPPRHVHTKEDEYYYLISGKVVFTIGEQQFDLKAGDFITLPKNIPHQFKLESETAKFILQIMPTGLENMFWELSLPATELELPPPPAGPPSPEFLKKLKELQQQYGIKAIDNSQIVAS